MKGQKSKMEDLGIVWTEDDAWFGYSESDHILLFLSDKFLNALPDDIKEKLKRFDSIQCCDNEWYATPTYQNYVDFEEFLQLLNNRYGVEGLDRELVYILVSDN